MMVLMQLMGLGSMCSIPDLGGAIRHDIVGPQQGVFHMEVGPGEE